MEKYAFVRLLCHDSLHLLREGENHHQHLRSGATLPGSVPNPDPRVFGPPGSRSDPLVRGMDPDPDPALDPDPSIIKQI